MIMFQYQNKTFEKFESTKLRFDERGQSSIAHIKMYAFVITIHVYSLSYDINSSK